MTEYELVECLVTLFGFNDEGGSSELHVLDTATSGDILEQKLAHNINAISFAREILGFEHIDSVANHAVVHV